MSLELSSADAVDCACGNRFAFIQYHWPHCPTNPTNLKGTMKVAVESRFTKSELAQIATHGPMADKRIGKKKRGKHAPA